MWSKWLIIGLILLFIPSSLGACEAVIPNKTKAMSKKNGLPAADGEYRIIPIKMKVKANRVNVRMFGMNLSINKIFPF